jgi:uncharacterized membrane protein
MRIWGCLEPARTDSRTSACRPPTATLIGSLITAFVGARAVQFTQLTGLSGDDTSLLSAVANNVSLQGLLTCGVVVAGLGVLNDVTITQASARRLPRRSCVPSPAASGLVLAVPVTTAIRGSLQTARSSAPPP